jgi:hypothetical protein
MDPVDRLLEGAVDLHCHSGPSPMPRRITHAEAAAQADGVGMRAIVAKCHYHSTVFDVLAMEPQLAGLKTKVYGGVALNSQVGGINPHVVDLSLRMGGRVIWFPTISATAHLCHAAHDPVVQAHFQPKGLMQSEEVDIFGPDGDLLPEVHTVIGMAKDAGAMISAGHLAPDRILALLTAVHAAGHDRVLVSHPNFVIKAEREQVVRYAELGATIEHELGMYDNDRIFDLQTLVDWIGLIGPERTSIASDLGQVGNPLPLEAYRRVLTRLLDSGVTEKDITTMIATNPARLIGLDD